MPDQRCPCGEVHELAAGVRAAFTDRARRAMVLAEGEARLMGHGEVGTGHLLLGLAAEKGGVASQALAALGLNQKAARGTMIRITAEAPIGPPPDIPLTPRARLAQEAALREALRLGHLSAGTGHLLLGLLGMDDEAMRVLDRAGITRAAVRGEVMRRLGPCGDLPVAAVTAAVQAKRALEFRSRSMHRMASDAEIATAMLAAAAPHLTAAEHYPLGDEGDPPEIPGPGPSGERIIATHVAGTPEPGRRVQPRAATHPLPSHPRIWRTGRTLGLSLYVQVEGDDRKADIYCGVADSPAIAEHIVAVLNAAAREQASGEDGKDA